MIRITKVRQRLNSFVRISLLVKFVFTGKSVDEKANYIIVPCTPLITNLQSRFQAIGNSGRKRERAHARETRETSPLACLLLARPFFSCAHYFQASATQATGKAPVSYWPFFPLSIVTVPEVNSAQFLVMLVFSVTPFRIDQNKNQNRSIDKVQNLGNERR